MTKQLNYVIFIKKEITKINKNLGDGEMIIQLRLNELLKERNLTQKEFAKLSGIREATVSELCRNVRDGINKTHLNKIANTLNIEDINSLIEIKH